MREKKQPFKQQQQKKAGGETLQIEKTERNETKKIEQLISTFQAKCHD